MHQCTQETLSHSRRARLLTRLSVLHHQVDTNYLLVFLVPLCPDNPIYTQPVLYTYLAVVPPILFLPVALNNSINQSLRLLRRPGLTYRRSSAPPGQPLVGPPLGNPVPPAAVQRPPLVAREEERLLVFRDCQPQPPGVHRHRLRARARVCVRCCFESVSENGCI